MFISIGKTNIGLKRKVNQDYFKIGNIFDIAWAIVCDGLGGEKAGDVASRTATEVIYSYIQQTCKENMPLDDIKDMMIRALNLANMKIFDLSQENEEYKGMATTAVISIIVNGFLHIAHVGDSRAYLIDKDNVLQLTKDHSLVQALIEKGTLSEDKAKKHPKRNYLTKAVGVEKDLDVDYQCISISDDKLVLVCTDGLYNYADEDIIKNIFKETILADLTDRFVDLAIDSGGCDNITVVIMFNENYNNEGRVN